MLYREIIAVCSQIHTKHIYTLCGQNVELLNVKLAVHIVTTGFKGYKVLVPVLLLYSIPSLAYSMTICQSLNTISTYCLLFPYPRV